MNSRKPYTKCDRHSAPNFSGRGLRALLPAALIALAGSAALAGPWALASHAKHAPAPRLDGAISGIPATTLTPDEAIAHALNRLGYGPRPGDIERVKQTGLSKWIDQQLHPESIDDAGVAARLAQFTTLTMSSEQLETTFPRPAVAAKRAGMTVQEYQKQQQEQMRAIGRQYGAGEDPRMSAPASQPNGAESSAAMQSNTAAASSDSMAPDAPAAVNRRDAKREGIPPDAMKNLEQIRNPQRIVAELAMAKTDRAIYSDRQLYEHMVDFWFNHFNVFAGKGADRWLLTSYERDAIRPNAMGKFRDLLEATAKSPAMLFYLDNWQSVDPDAWKQREAQVASGPLGALLGVHAGAAAKKQDRGLNENYGRELLELHTLGVDAGYTQQDVINVARAFTGWTIRMPQRDPQFFFNDRLHDSKSKVVLGHTIDGGGMKDGEQVLDLLARDPRTAHHLSYEIAQEFVSDAPPAALVERMTQTYLATDGDIRSVLHTMIYSPEFWSADAYRAKVKTPFELVISAARAMNADVQLPLAMVQWVGRIGEPLYQCQTPNGYSDQAIDWVNTGALLNRLNYSLTLVADQLRGASVDAAALLSAPASGGAAVDVPFTGVAAKGANRLSEKAAIDRAVAVLLAGEVSAQTLQTLDTQLEKFQATPAVVNGAAREASGATGERPINLHLNDALVAGLVLGAPEFQRR